MRCLLLLVAMLVTGPAIAAESVAPSRIGGTGGSALASALGAHGPLEEAAREAGAGKPAELIRLASEYAARNTLADSGSYPLALQAAGLLAAGQKKAAVAAARALEQRLSGGVGTVSAMWLYAVYLHAGEGGEAIRVLRKLQADQPRETNWQDELAWILATHPSKALRNGAEAVQWGESACRISRGRDSHPSTALAAALAEVGRFEEAAARQAEILNRARAESWSPDALLRARKRLALFQSRQPYRIPLGPEWVRLMLRETFDVNARATAVQGSRGATSAAMLPAR